MPKPWNKLYFDPEMLKKLYEVEGLSISQIASRIGCTTTPIQRLLKENQIDIRTISQAKEKFKISRQELINLYQHQKLSTEQIAEKYKCNHVTIVNRMKKFGIKSRGNLGLRKPMTICKENLEYLYTKRRLSLEKIARILHRSKGGVERKMLHYDISTRGLANRASKYKKFDFDGNLDEKAYMVGFRLGDLNVIRRVNIICARCSTTIKAQINLIRNLFKKYGGVNCTIAKRGTYEIICFLNNSFNFLLPKIDNIPEWVLANNKLFIAFFAGYVDAEGCIHIHSRSGGRKIPFGGLQITSYDKNILQQSWINLMKLDILCPKPLLVKPKGYIDKRGLKSNGDAWRLSIYRKASVWKLFNFIEPYLRHSKKNKALKIVQKNIILRNRLPYCRRIELSVTALL